MKLTLESAKAPQWADAAKTAINVTVRFKEIPGEDLPFTATANDPEEHGRDIYARAVAGEFGAVAAYVAPPPLPPSVPTAVTMRQVRLALLNAGLLSRVSAAISALPSPRREAVEIEWEYSTTVARSGTLGSAFGPALGMTDAQVDALFVQAAKL